MLFLLKKNPVHAILACLSLIALALLIRHYLPDPLPVLITSRDLLDGLLVVAILIGSDGLIHLLLLLLFGQAYELRHRAFCEVFRGQSFLAMLAGAVMAGTGEELLFRSFSLSWGYLIPSAVIFGLAHHLRAKLWPFTIWAIWQGLLISLALRVTGSLGVTMTAHFLHDLIGFLLIRWLLTHQYLASSPT